MPYQVLIVLSMGSVCQLTT